MDRVFLCASAALLTMTAGIANAQSVTRYFDKSLYPARLSSVNFQNGSAMTASNPACWGNWCVKIGSSTIANYNNNGVLIIQDLTCTNSVAGEKGCFITLSQDAGCGLWNAGEPFTIKCPKSIDFSR